MTGPLEDEFGDIVGKARRGMRLELRELAEQAGIAEVDVGRLESCEEHPTREESDRLANVLSLEPKSLWNVATDGWRPQPQVPTLSGGLQVRMIPHPPMRVTMYVVGDPATGQALVLDPGARPDTIRQVVREAGWQVVAYLITHCDADHVGALADVHVAMPAPVWVHADARHLLPEVSSGDVMTITDDGPLTVGPFDTRVLQTPGHARGHVSYALRDGVLVGDTIFAGSIGGTLLGPEYYAGQLAAIRAKLLTCPDDTKLLAGHGPPTTVGEEKRHNPFLAAASRL